MNNPNGNSAEKQTQNRMLKAIGLKKLDREAPTKANKDAWLRTLKAYGLKG